MNASATLSQADAGPVIKFRAECAADADAIRALLWPWTVSYRATLEALEYEGRLLPGDNVEAIVELRHGAPTLEELRYMLDAVPNAHIAAETLEAEANFTGERDSRPKWAGAVARPSREVLEPLLEAVVLRETVLEAELERMKQAYRTLRAMYDLGTRWQPPAEGDGPGWLLVLNLPGTNLNRFVRVEAQKAADLYSATKKNRAVDSRMRVLAS